MRLQVARSYEYHMMKPAADCLRDIARSLDIEHLLQRKPGQLSVGQKQRVALAWCIWWV